MTVRNYGGPHRGRVYRPRQLGWTRSSSRRRPASSGSNTHPSSRPSGSSPPSSPSSANLLAAVVFTVIVVNRTRLRSAWVVAGTMLSILLVGVIYALLLHGSTRSSPAAPPSPTSSSTWSTPILVPLFWIAFVPKGSLTRRRSAALGHLPARPISLTPSPVERQRQVRLPLPQSPHLRLAPRPSQRNPHRGGLSARRQCPGPSSTAASPRGHLPADDFAGLPAIRRSLSTENTPGTAFAWMFAIAESDSLFTTPVSVTRPLFTIMWIALYPSGGSSVIPPAALATDGACPKAHRAARVPPQRGLRVDPPVHRRTDPVVHR